ncbi:MULTISPECIES: chemotaxis protein CheB [Methylobacterium]|uniref:protein-glutamate methylesterase n=2 Tax=Pseudomonadota TaxID=1224 RepID=A0ABQ4SSB8_9HYPH|nr:MULTISPECIES: chemotaxis protein CheB [Methylobacterium]PIU06535.1 MAG: chemotaxis protein CheB [Methylobacterium sp. CG09_land_8_20_14_0_10_71_15]PIU11103.1 MAG: chemotaxis protein CheB [Methylobacterium sp. CG08_land_8_20_14_0_20_71_15]GBU16497.1 chemotaxis protein-glutamate methylesterase [Methylobacterium sp.]GJE06104.1 Protein-glutamate methylesterase/protein-glutamine glutaminase [Methylobacterium jeotgali]
MSNRDIIVIGGSAGSLPPLRAILGSLPADLPAAVLVVLHMPSQGSGIVATLAGSGSALPVRQAEDGMAIEPGRIYTAAPDHHLLIHDRQIVLGHGPRENLTRPAIDPLFRAAAVNHGPRVIGVILSGLLSDGAAGLNAVQRCGGFTLVQDPADAASPDMPRRAMEATMVDLCVPGAKIGPTLVDLAHERPGAQVPVPPELSLEIDIAAGGRINTAVLSRFAQPAALTCPSCGGVLSRVKVGEPLRFRCQVGHAFTADVLASEQESRVDEAIRVALRIIEERAELVHRMAEDGRHSGRRAVAEMYDARAMEYREYADTLRRAVLRSIAPKAPVEDKED